MDNSVPNGHPGIPFPFQTRFDQKRKHAEACIRGPSRSTAAPHENFWHDRPDSCSVPLEKGIQSQTREAKLKLKN